jgi:translocator assembly and maintenance protein 41
MYRPALTQSVKGLFTAGFTKSVRYSLAKIGKWWKARQARSAV